MMREPSLRTSRLAIAATLLALAAAGGGGFFLGRTTAPRATSTRPAATAASEPQPVSVAPVERVLDRADLIDIATLASDAVVAGAAVPDLVIDAVGRRFELAVPFGCSGPSSDESSAPLRWRYDEDEEVLRVHAAVVRWEAADWGMGDAAEIEAVEGFWIARPWTASAECPRAAISGGTREAGPAAVPERTLAVAQFHASGVRREALREGRPFETVQRVPAGEFAAPRGFRLMVSGRIDRAPDVGEPDVGEQGGPVRCVQPGGTDQRPICVVAVTVGEVRIENSASGEVLASWAIGRD